MALLSRNKRKYQSWFLSFVIINMIILFIAVISNPYRLTPINLTIPGINDVKPRLYDLQRYVKLFDIAHQKPKTIILGSSRVLWGIDPKNKLLKHYPPVYNAGILGPPMYETAEYFKHALINQPDLKRVILALDFYSFNAQFDHRDFPFKDIFGKKTKEIIKLRKEMLLDYAAMFQSFWYSLTRKRVKSLREDGRLTPDPLEARDIYKKFFNPGQHNPKPKLATQTVPNNNAYVVPDVNKAAVATSKKTADNQSITLKNNTQEKAPPKMRNALYNPFSLSPQSMNALREMIETCKKRNIELIIYLTPTLENTEQTYFRTNNLWKDFAAFQKELAKLHPFWDFTSWNKITMDRNNFIDGSHHIFPVGNLILKKLFNINDPNIPANFGRYITAKNVNNHLETLTSEYNHFIKTRQYV